MSNINQTQDLFAFGAMQDLDNESAATRSGGVGYLNSGDPDVILYNDQRFQGASLGLNAATGDGLPNFGTRDGNGGGGNNGFNHKNVFEKSKQLQATCTVRVNLLNIKRVIAT